MLETTDKIANKLVQQVQLLKRRSKKCGENTRPRQRDGAPERSEVQRLVYWKITLENPTVRQLQQKSYEKILIESNNYLMLSTVLVMWALNITDKS